jgi:alanyl-tRNA synthetase
VKDLEKLFYKDVYLTDWESGIESIDERENRFYVVLEKTAFYPEGGGQPSDRGFIDGIPIIDVKEENHVIYHVLDESPKNKIVSCKLDFARRFDLMQQHTGQHLFSAIFFYKYKGETSSFHLGEDYISVDISIADIPPEMLTDVEMLANEYIMQNLQVLTHNINYEEISKFPLRKLPPVNGEIRIVEIDKLDFSPCCGTHVSKTSEIGVIKIIKTERYKGLTRIYLKCGKRALLDFQNKTNLVQALCKLFSASENEILERIEGEGIQIKTLSKQLIELKEKLNTYEAADIINSSTDKLIYKIFENKSFSDIQSLGKQILQAGDYVLILVSAPDNRLLLAHNGTKKLDCGKLLKEQLPNFKGRGGGSMKQAQGGFEDAADMNAFIEFLLKNSPF